MVTETLLCGLGYLVSEWHLLFPKARDPTTSRFIYTTQVSEGQSVPDRTSEHDHMVGALQTSHCFNSATWSKIQVIRLSYHITLSIPKHLTFISKILCKLNLFLVGYFQWYHHQGGSHHTYYRILHIYFNVRRKFCPVFGHPCNKI